MAKLISQRDPQTSELALSLLDNLVKNCGYPFQLQISRKEFLNELVKRFPERPPLRYSRVQRLILAQIEEWYQTICKTSKYKDDFGYIKDMHRLLGHKGYIFPEIKIEDAAVLNPSDTLKSFEELQKEEEMVNSAKLQEFVRRGKPQDLQEANKLMKIMAGFKESNKLQENKQQIDDDIARLRRKAEILDEMLSSIQNSGGKIDDNGEALSELYASIKSNQPIINKIIEEESDNEEKVNNLLSLNDNINGLISKYQLLKNGKVDEASQIKASVNTEMNLIDFDDDEPISNDQSGRDNQGYNDLLSDLSNLSFGNNSGNNSNTNQQKSSNDILNLFGSGGSIALGGPNPGQPTQQPQQQSNNNIDLLGDLNSPSPQLQSNTQSQGQQPLDPFGLNFPNSTPLNVQSTGSKTSTINQSSVLKTEVEILPTSTDQICNGRFIFSNLQSSTLTKFKFMLAAPKSCKLNLSGQSGDMIYGFSNRGITQDFSIENSAQKQLKVKWKAEYLINNQPTEESGVSNLTE